MISSFLGDNGEKREETDMIELKHHIRLTLIYTKYIRFHQEDILLASKRHKVRYRWGSIFITVLKDRTIQIKAFDPLENRRDTEIITIKLYII